MTTVWQQGDVVGPTNLNSKGGAFGMVALTGTTADRLSIQSQVNAFSSSSLFGQQRGGTIMLSAGTAAIDSTITIPPGVRLIGAGRDASVLSWVGGSGFMITVGVGGSPGENNQGAAVTDMALLGSATASGGIQVGDTNIATNFASSVELARLQLHGFTGSGATALFLENPSHIDSTLVHIYNVPNGTALHVDANGLNTGVFSFHGCRFGGSSTSEVQNALTITSTSNVVDGILFGGCFFRGTGVVANLQNTTATDFLGCHFESGSSTTAMVIAKTWLASRLEGCTFGGNGATPVGILLTGTGSARKLTIGNNWFTNIASTGTIVQITPPGAGVIDNVFLLPNHISTTTPAPLDDSGNFATVLSDTSVHMTRFTAKNDGSANQPAFAFASEQSLGFYRSGASQIGFANSQLLGTAGSQPQPPYAFLSEASLGVYRSAASTIGMSYGQFGLNIGSRSRPGLGFTSDASLGFYSSSTSAIGMSYGTFDLRNAALSLRTTASVGSSSNLTQGEVCLVNVSATSAQLAFRSGATTYLFNAVVASP